MCVFQFVCVWVSADRHTDNISDFNLIINALVVQPKTDIDNVRAQPVNNYRVCSNCETPCDCCCCEWVAASELVSRFELNYCVLATHKLIPLHLVVAVCLG